MLAHCKKDSNAFGFWISSLKIGNITSSTGPVPSRCLVNIWEMNEFGSYFVPKIKWENMWCLMPMCFGNRAMHAPLIFFSVPIFKTGPWPGGSQYSPGSPVGGVNTARKSFWLWLCCCWLSLTLLLNFSCQLAARPLSRVPVFSLCRGMWPPTSRGLLFRRGRTLVGEVGCACVCPCTSVCVYLLGRLWQGTCVNIF